MSVNTVINTFALPFMNVPLTANAFFVRGERGVMIDAGPKQTAAENPLLKELDALGVNPGDIEQVFFTHWHQDHTGGCEVLLEKGARLYISEAETEFLQNHDAAFAAEMLPLSLATGESDEETAASREELIATLPSELTAPELVAPGDNIDLGGASLSVIGLRGHTAGSVGYFLASEGILLAGDGICGSGTRAGCMPLINSLDQYIATVTGLMSLDIGTVLLSHDFQAPGLTPSRSYSGGPVRMYLSASLEFAERLRDESARLAAKRGHPFIDACNEIIAAMPVSYGFLPVEKQASPKLTLRTLLFALRDFAGWSAACSLNE